MDNNYTAEMKLFVAVDVIGELQRAHSEDAPNVPFDRYMEACFRGMLAGRKMAKDLRAVLSSGGVFPGDGGNA